MILMTWVYWYYWPLPLLNIGKGLPCLQCCFVVFFGTRFAFSQLPLQRNAKKSFCHFCLPAEDKFWLSLLFTDRKINIGPDMRENICTNKFFLAFSYCNLFFQMSKIMKQNNPVHIRHPTTGIQAHIPDLNDQSNDIISQDISLQ